MEQQEIALEIRRLRRYIVSECLSIVEKNFADEARTNSTRVPSEQTLLGNNNMVIEQNIKNELKSLI